MTVVPERYGTRDLCFSGWHRTLHESLKCQDVDFFEYCHRCGKAVALIETAQDVGQKYKYVTPLRKLAKECSLPAFLVFYKGNGKPPPESRVFSIRAKRIYPRYSEEIVLTPKQYERFLIELRISNGQHKRCFKSIPFEFWENAEPYDTISALFE